MVHGGGPEMVQLVEPNANSKLNRESKLLVFYIDITMLFTIDCEETK